MVRLPDNPHTTIAAIERAVVASADDGFRPHLGASLLGGPCDRALWFAFRWAAKPTHPPRVLRLFARGSREEEVFAQLLRRADVTVLTVDPATGKQFRHSACGGHVGGSMDGAVQGLVEAPKKWHVLECKTHSAKSFAGLKAKGVKASKPEHWHQCNLYMHWSNMERAYYFAVNKDDDELYGERLEYDRVEAQKLLARAERIVQSKEPPPGVSTDPAWWQCKFCAYRDQCHAQRLPLPHCRTCLHATPEPDGEARWSCARWQADIPLEAQKEGCPEHRYIPGLVTYARPVDASESNNWVEYELTDGRRFRNGQKGPSSYPSTELAVLVPSAINDPGIEQIRQQFNGTVTHSTDRRAAT